MSSAGDEEGLLEMKKKNRWRRKKLISEDVSVGDFLMKQLSRAKATCTWAWPVWAKYQVKPELAQIASNTKEKYCLNVPV